MTWVSWLFECRRLEGLTGEVFLLLLPSHRASTTEPQCLHSALKLTSYRYHYYSEIVRGDYQIKLLQTNSSLQLASFYAVPRLAFERNSISYLYYKMVSQAGSSTEWSRRKLKKQEKPLHATRGKKINAREQLETLDRLAMEFVSKPGKFGRRLGCDCDSFRNLRRI